MGMSASVAKRIHAAWEFLRRNPEYRAEYATFVELKAPLEGKYGPVANWSQRQLRNEPRAWHYWPPKAPTESDAAWTIRAACEGHEPQKTLMHQGYARRWGLAEMVDPVQGTAESVRFLVEQAPMLWHRVEDIEVEPFDEDGGPPSSFYVRLDATRNASRQITALRKALVSRQRQLKSFGLRWRTTLHESKWPLYLRVFDAISAGLTAKDVAKAEFPHVKDQYPEYAGQARVRATYGQALTLVQHGYRRIALADD